MSNTKAKTAELSTEISGSTGQEQPQAGHGGGAVQQYQGAPPRPQPVGGDGAAPRGLGAAAPVPQFNKTVGGAMGQPRRHVSTLSPQAPTFTPSSHGRGSSYRRGGAHQSVRYFNQQDQDYSQYSLFPAGGE